MTVFSNWCRFKSTMECVNCSNKSKCRIVQFQRLLIIRWEDIANGKREGKRLQANYPGPRWCKKHLKRSFSNLRDRYVLGGIHLTNLAFLPNALLKEITATEYKRSITSFYNNHFALADLEEQQVGRFILNSLKTKSICRWWSTTWTQSLFGDQKWTRSIRWTTSQNSCLGSWNATLTDIHTGRLSSDSKSILLC